MGGIRSEAFLFEDEYCLIRETVYPLSHRHGRYSFSELDDVMALWNKGGLTHTLSAEGYEKASCSSLILKRPASAAGQAI